MTVVQKLCTSIHSIIINSFRAQIQLLIHYSCLVWWRHPMETFYALLAHCAGNSPVPGEFPTQRPVTRSFGVFFDLRLNKRLSKQAWCWWFLTPSRPLWCHRNGYSHYSLFYAISHYFRILQAVAPCVCGWLIKQRFSWGFKNDHSGAFQILVHCRNRNSHCKDKMDVCNGNPYTWIRRSLYLNGTQGFRLTSFVILPLVVSKMSFALP